MIKRVVAHFARKSHDVRVQAGLAMVYGLLHLFGVTGTVAIAFKLRKLNQKQRGKR